MRRVRLCKYMCLCERRELKVGRDPRYYDVILATFMSIDLRFEYKREVSLISEPPDFRACSEVQARGMRV